MLKYANMSKTQNVIANLSKNQSAIARNVWKTVMLAAGTLKF